MTIRDNAVGIVLVSSHIPIVPVGVHLNDTVLAVVLCAAVATTSCCTSMVQQAAGELPVTGERGMTSNPESDELRTKFRFGGAPQATL